MKANTAEVIAFPEAKGPGRPPKQKRKLKNKPLTASMERRITREVEAAQFENPICHITIIGDTRRDFCNYLQKEDEPRESLFAHFAKRALREKLTMLLQKELIKKRGVVV